MKFRRAEKKSKVTVFSLILEKLGDNKLKTLKKIVNKKIFLFLTIGFLIFCIFTAGVVVQRNYGFSNLIAKPIVLDSIGTIKRKILSYFASPEILIVDLKFEDGTTFDGLPTKLFYDKSGFYVVTCKSGEVVTFNIKEN